MSRKSKIDPIVKVKIVEQYFDGEIGLSQTRQVKNLELPPKVLENVFLYTNAMDQQVYLISPKTRVTQKH